MHVQHGGVVIFGKRAIFGRAVAFRFGIALGTTHPCKRESDQ